jgi:hypothetical protein
MSNILVSFQFLEITLIYFPYLFPIRSLGSPYLQINIHNAYDLRFGRSSYAWKDKEIRLLTQLVPWSTTIWVAPQMSKQNCLTVSTNMQYFLSIKYSRHNYSPIWCTHKYVIISFHNELMTNLAITYISLPYLYLIDKFLSKYLLTTIHWWL